MTNNDIYHALVNNNNQTIINNKNKKMQSPQHQVIDSEQLSNEIDLLLSHFDIDITKADIQKTRKSLNKFRSVNETLTRMRESN